MDQRFLEYYNRELRHVRETAGEFGKEFPKIAGRLGIESLEVADPYVERLLEGFAFMAARVQIKIDSQFPKFTQHLLDIVYPHFQAPLPAMAVVQLQPDLNEGALSEGFPIEKDTAMRSLLGKGDKTSCEFRTAHELKLWPLEITDAKYFASDSELAATGWTNLQGAKAGIRLSVHTTAGLAFNQLGLDSICCYLPGNDELPMKIYEQLFANGIGFLVKPRGDKSATPTFVEAKHICQVGFEDDQALMPYPRRSFQGYRLLQEYFAFPRRFLFFELTGLRKIIANCSSTELDIVVLLDRSNHDLHGAIGKENFLLNCTPVINLFSKRADRVQIEPGKHEYHVLPDRTRPLDFEV